MGLQSWRNFVVIQHRDRDKLDNNVCSSTLFDRSSKSGKEKYYIPSPFLVDKGRGERVETSWLQIANTPQLQVF